MKKKAAFLALTVFVVLCFPMQLPASFWQPLNGPSGYFSPQKIISHQGAWFASSNTNGSTGTGVWKSSNNGASWTDVSAGLTKPYARDFASIGSDLFIACDTVVYKTSNGGSSWNTADNGLPDYTSVYELVVHNNAVYACVFYGTGNVEIFSSTGGTGTWTSTGYTFGFSQTPNQLYSSGNTLWAATTAGLYKSTDGGITFNFASNNIPFNASVGSIIAIGDTAYCGTTNGSYFTTNGGQLWMPITHPVLGSTIYTYCWELAGDSIFAGFTNYGVYACALGQTNFDLFGTGYITNNLAWDMEVNGNLLMAATAEGIYSCSTNGGAWQQQNSNINRARTRVAYVDQSVILAGTGVFTGLQRSVDGGLTWTPTPLQNQFRIFEHGMLYNNRIIIPSNGNIHISDDNGITFSSPFVAPLPNYDVKVYGNSLIACSGSNVVQSFDDGDTWSILGSGIPSPRTVYSLAVSGSTIYAGTNSGVFRYNPLQNTWSDYSTGLSAPLLVQDIEMAGATLVINGSMGVYKRSPLDSIWKPGALNTYLNELVYFDGFLFGAGLNGVSVSDDAGKTFRPWNEGMPEYIGDGENLYGFDHTLYCGAREYSAWRRDVNLEIQTIDTSTSFHCAGDSLEIFGFIYAPVLAGNKYILQLSDPSGDFFTYTALDSITSVASSVSLTARIPVNTLPGNNYRFRIVSTAPALLSLPTSRPFTILPRPVIQLQPAQQSVCDGDNSGFYVGVSTSDCAYQWQVDVTGSGVFSNLTNNSQYQQTDSALLLINSATVSMNGYKYRCIISSPCTTLTSNAATLVVNALTPLLTQPVNDTICLGDGSIFQVLAQGAGNTYQWQSSTGSGFFNITAGSQYSGINTGTLTINFTSANDVGRQYRCRINGCTMSDTALLAINGIPFFNPLPAALPYCNNGNGNINAQLSGGQLSYQWERDTGTGFNIITDDLIHQGTSSGHLQLTGIPAGFDGYAYRCKVYGACSPDSAISSAVLLQLQASPAIVNPPSPVSVCEGDTAVYTVLATGSFLGYQWEINTGTGWNPIPPLPPFTGTTTNTLQIDSTFNAINNAQFRCNLSSCIQSTAAGLTLKAIPQITAPIINWCANYPPLNLSQATPVGGIYYGNYIANNTLNYSESGYIQIPYDYLYTAPNGCTGIAANYIVIDNCNQLTETSGQSTGWLLYPNPASTQVTLRAENNHFNKAQVQIINMAGKTVQKREISGQFYEITLELQHLPEGLYLILIQTGDEYLSKKLVISH